MVFTIHYPVYRWDYKSASSHYHAAFQHWPALGLRPITLSFPLLQGLILPLSTGRQYFIWMNLSNFRRNFINLIKSMWAGPLHHHPSLKTNKNSEKKTPSSRAWLVGIQESWENISKMKAMSFYSSESKVLRQFDDSLPSAVSCFSSWTFSLKRSGPSAIFSALNNEHIPFKKM